MKRMNENFRIITKMHEELDKINCEEYNLEIKFKDKMILSINKEFTNKEKKIGFDRG